MNSTFMKYVLVGVVNTFIHWSILGVSVYLFHLSQAFSNFLGFAVAVTFSFFINAKWTFDSETSWVRYFTFVGFMGLLAYTFGWIADYLTLPPLATAVTFSAFSLVVGYLYSKLVVFSKKNLNPES